MSSVIHSLVPCLKSLVPYNGDMKYLYKFIRFTHLWVTGKFEYRNSKQIRMTKIQNLRPVAEIEDKNEAEVLKKIQMLLSKKSMR